MTPGNGSDPDLPELMEWLEQIGRSPLSVQPLPGDVSARRYFRAHLADGGTVIAALYPASIADACQRYLLSSELLRGVRARVPAVLEADCARGMMLLEDVGEETFYQRAAREPWNVSSWFQQSMSIAAAIATLPIDPVRRLNPPLDAEMLRNELQRTWDVFARERTPAHLATPLQDVFDTLCADIGRDPLRPCHRDFMVRNLVPYSTPVEIVVLDHQDLRLGPRFYDIASLLNDSLFPSPALEGALLDDRLETRGDERLYHQTAAQRTLKAVGTYAAAAAEGRGQHLPLLEPTLRRAFQHLRRIPEARAMVAELESAWTVPTERSPGRTGRIDDGP